MTSFLWLAVWVSGRAFAAVLARCSYIPMNTMSYRVLWVHHLCREFIRIITWFCYFVLFWNMHTVWENNKIQMSSHWDLSNIIKPSLINFTGMCSYMLMTVYKLFLAGWSQKNYFVIDMLIPVQYIYYWECNIPVSQMFVQRIWFGAKCLSNVFDLGKEEVWKNDVLDTCYISPAVSLVGTSIEV